MASKIVFTSIGGFGAGRKDVIFIDYVSSLSPLNIKHNIITKDTENLNRLIWSEIEHPNALLLFIHLIGKEFDYVQRIFPVLCGNDVEVILVGDAARTVLFNLFLNPDSLNYVDVRLVQE